MRNLLITRDNGKNFKIAIPDDAKVTFGPWSPPSKKEGYGSEHNRVGTLRIYRKSKDDIIACFAHVTSFRDLSLSYMEEVAREEGAVLWKSDEKGYVREDKVKSSTEWTRPAIPPPPPGEEEEPPKKRKR